MKSNLENKLIRVERTVNTYKGDSQLVDETVIDDISFEVLSTVVIPKKDDPLLYDGYVLQEEQLHTINGLTENKIYIDLSKFYYVLECNGIYDWQS